ncbi:MAG: sigma-70 family RNA polymerase sigma factor [Chloroflexi bacterium]|nr:MAG: sigma-70 family RNA polymerase sigma factor [Chloroflexota bacterium]
MVSIAEARAGDQVAFETLIRPLIHPAYRLAYAMLRRREAAEDAVQESVLKAWRGIGRLHPETESIRPWFLTIVANECRSVRRARWWNVLPLTQGRSAGFNEQRLAEKTDLRQSIDRLSHHDRLLLYLYYWLDLPLDEIAQAMGITTQATKGRLYRAVGRLRQRLMPEEMDNK